MKLKLLICKQGNRFRLTTCPIDKLRKGHSGSYTSNCGAQWVDIPNDNGSAYSVLTLIGQEVVNSVPLPENDDDIVEITLDVNVLSYNIQEYENSSNK